MSNDYLPYGRQSITDDDVAAVVDALKSDYLTTGPRVTAFEAAFATKVGASHAVACANGTAALHAALLALGIGPGDTAIVPAITFLATANAARFCGAHVEFADVNPATGLMTPQTFTDALARCKATGHTPRVVLPVHLAGQLCDMPAITSLARDHDMFVVEDACHALGSVDAQGDWAGACALSDAACFSFHPVKTIATGEGGMITTSSADIATKLRRFICHGMVRDTDDLIAPEFSCDSDGQRLPWAYEMQTLGYNYRLNDIQAALGLSQLKRLDDFIARRRQIAQIYDDRLADLSEHLKTMAHIDGQQTGLHLYVVRIDFDALGQPREQMMRRLAANGVGTQVHYMPVPHQPYYRTTDTPNLPGADSYYARCLSLPLFPAMTDADVDTVIGVMDEVLG